MNVTSRSVWRGALIALAAAVVVVPPAAAEVAAEPGVASEPEAASEPEEVDVGSEFMAPDPVTLELAPLCTAEGLRRFAVAHVAGPPTRFTVSVAGTEDGQELAIETGATRHFWVEAGASDEVAITWSDGSASAQPADDPCTPDANEGGGRAPSGDPAAIPSADPAPGQRGGPVPDRGSRNAPGPSRSPEPEAAAPPAAAPDETREAPSARPGGRAGACPEGWVHVETSDRCEIVIETASDARPVGSSFPAAALVITIALLIASIGAGSRHRA